MAIQSPFAPAHCLFIHFGITASEDNLSSGISLHRLSTSNSTLHSHGIFVGWEWITHGRPSGWEAAKSYYLLQSQ
jgi:hypothetical protein